MATTGFIYDPEDGTCLAHIVNGDKVFDATTERPRRIGTIDSTGTVYGQKGELIGQLGTGGHFTDDLALTTFENCSGAIAMKIRCIRFDTRIF